MTNSHYDGFTIGLGRVLAEAQGIDVPDHQREYRWERDDVDQLINDIELAIHEGVQDYFLGLMVFIQTGLRLSVLDGQQRLATAVILLSAIRDWLNRHDRASEGIKITNNFIGISPLGETTIRPRLRLNQLNNPFFHEYVANEQDRSTIEDALSRLSRHDPSRLLLEATLHCRTRIDEIALKAGEVEIAARKLYTLVDYLDINVRVVRLVVPNESDAYRVFETLNYRGRDLSTLDLVKSYLYSRADDRQEWTRLRDMKARWTEMLAALSDVKGDTFLRVFWTSRHGRTRLGDIYPELKEHYKTGVACVALSSEMAEAAPQYAALDIADDPLWTRYSKDAREDVRTLKLLGSTAVHPVLLSGLAKLSDRELERLLRLLVVWTVRDQLIIGGRTGQFETSCAKLAHEIYRGNVTTASAALAQLRDVYPSDEQFKQAFRLKQETANPKAVYLLRMLELEKMRRNGGPVGIIEPARGLSIEHVLPKNPASEWADVIARDPRIVEECATRLGNLCLLTQANNRELGNKSFEEKRSRYAAKDQLLTTQEVAEFEEWSRKSIGIRQSKMAEMAVTIWSFR